MSMLFTINNSPFFGKDGKFVTSRHIKDRLDKELEKNLALKVKPGLNADSFVVYGRGVLHLSVLIEEMRREGFELQVGQPKVLDNRTALRAYRGSLVRGAGAVRRRGDRARYLQEGRSSAHGAER